MSIQFASARLVNDGDGVGVSDSSMCEDPAGVRSWVGEGAMGWSCRVAVYVCGAGCCSVRSD